MGSVPDLREIAAYSAMAELISEYFTKAKDGMGWGPTPGGMYQIASVQKKSGGSAWDRDAVPNAYIEPDGWVKIPITASDNTSVSNFLAKDIKTLQYFWDWAKQEANKNGEQLTEPSESNSRYILVQSYGGKVEVLEHTGPYDYRDSSNIKMKGIMIQDPVYLHTTGTAKINTDNVVRFVNGKPVSESESLSATSMEGKTLPEQNLYNNDLPDNGSYRSSTTVGPLYQGTSVEKNIGYEFHQSVETSDSYHVTTETFEETSIHVDSSVKYSAKTVYGDLDAEVNAAYDTMWKEENTVEASSSTIKQNETTLSENTTIRLEPVPVGKALVVNLGEDGGKHILEPGSTVTIEYVLSSGTYTDDINYPYELSGTYGSLELGTVSRPGVTTKSWDSHSGSQGGVGQPWIKGGSGSNDGRVGDLVKYANEYKWWNALNKGNVDDLESFIEVGTDDDDMKVNGATTTSTVVGTDAEIKLTQVLKTDNNNVSARSSDYSLKGRIGSRKARDVQALAQSYGQLRHLGQSKLRQFEGVEILDLAGEIDKMARRMRISDKDKKLIPGFSLPATLADQSLILRLPNKFNNINLADSNSPSLIFSGGSRGIVRLGKAADVIISARNKSSSIFAGKGADLIISKGKGDFISPGKGQNELHLLGGYTSVRLGGGADKILLGEDGKISINNFRPGRSRIGSSIRGSEKKSLASFDQNNFRLTASNLSSSGVFGLKDKRTGEIRGSLQFDKSLGEVNRGYWINYGLRFRNGKLLDRLSKAPELSGQYSMNRLGSEMVWQVKSSLDEFEALAKKTFMKRGFSQGSLSYVDAFDSVTGTKLKGKIHDFLENLHGDVFSSLGGQKALKRLRREGVSIEFDDYLEPGKPLEQLIASGYLNHRDSANMSPIFGSIMQGLETRFNSLESL